MEWEEIRLANDGQGKQGVNAETGHCPLQQRITSLHCETSALQRPVQVPEVMGKIIHIFTYFQPKNKKSTLQMCR